VLLGIIKEKILGLTKKSLVFLDEERSREVIANKDHGMMIMQEFDSPELILLELYLDHSRLRKSQGDLQVDRLLFCHIFVQRADP